MITRIVRMTFVPEHVPTFIAIWEGSKAKIRAMDGCHSVELLADATDPNVWHTFSHWESTAHLDAYRGSEVFGSVWPATKALFAAKAVAFSMQAAAE